MILEEVVDAETEKLFMRSFLHCSLEIMRGWG